MFTGLVESTGRITDASHRDGGIALTIEPAALPVSELALGESVAVSGVCLTVVEGRGARFKVLAGQETLANTTMGGLRAGSVVNLERALRMGDRLGGHMVSGHVDGIGRIAGRVDRGANLEITIEADPAIIRYVIRKGSIAVDGISLTVNTVDSSKFSVALIPHTVSATTLAQGGVGGKVNLEVDLIGKYVEKLAGPYERRD